MIKLKLYGSEVNSLFRLIGKDENALTFALSYVFSERKDLLILFLKKIGILPSVKGKNYKNFFNNCSISLQHYNDDKSGIKDITIEDDESKYRIVIEAKIDDSIPTVDQIIKYSDATKNKEWVSYDSRFIIILTRRNIPDKELRSIAKTLKPCKIALINITWSDIYELVNRFGYSKSQLFTDKLINELRIFLMEDYKIKYFEEEILCRKVTKKYSEDVCNSPDTGYYFDSGGKDTYIYPLCLFFCACYGKQRSNSKTGLFLRRVDKYDILSADEIISSGNKQLIEGFNNHLVFFPHDITNNRLHIFKLTERISIPLSKQRFNSGDKEYKKLTFFL